MMRALLLLFLALVGCTPRAVTLPDEHQHILEVTMAKWSSGEVDLPDPGDCLRGTMVRWAPSVDAFVARCRAEPNSLQLNPEEVAKAASCLIYDTETRWPTTFKIPIALLNYGQPVMDTLGGPALHEWLHALIACTLDRPDIFDGQHSDPRVWEAAGGEESVQALAGRSLWVSVNTGARE